jgi:hypothetical protein
MGLVFLIKPLSELLAFFLLITLAMCAYASFSRAAAPLIDGEDITFVQYGFF